MYGDLSILFWMIIILIILVFLLVLSIKYINKSSKELHDKTSDYRRLANGKPFCPNCGSIDLSANNKGFSMVTGTIGSKDVYVTCIKCGHRWKAGQYNYLYKD